MSAKAYDKKTAAFAGFIIQNIPSDLTDEIMDGWMENPEATKKFLCGLRTSATAEAQKSPALLPEVFRLAVDYGRSLEEMIAAGRYDWKNDDITAKRFPIKGSGTVVFEARYFHFDRTVSSVDVIAEIEGADKERPWSPAKIEHILAHGAASPEEQRKYPIIGLGSVAKVGGDRDVPGLWKIDRERNLSLYWFGRGWDDLYRFLAVRVVSAA